MGCIMSLIRTLRANHGSHLTVKQLDRQRRQRASRRQKPMACRTQSIREVTPPNTPDDELEQQGRSFSFESNPRGGSSSPGGSSVMSSPYHQNPYHPGETSSEQALPSPRTPRRKGPKFSFSGRKLKKSRK